MLLNAVLYVAPNILFANESRITDNFLVFYKLKMIRELDGYIRQQFKNIQCAI